MPVARATGEDVPPVEDVPTDSGVALAATLIIALIIALMLAIVVMIAGRLLRALALPARLATSPRLIERSTAATLSQFDRALLPEAARIVATAYRTGSQAAADDLGTSGSDQDGTAGELSAELVETIRTTYPVVTRWAQRSYDDVIRAADLGRRTGAQTRLDAAQQAWEQILARGVTGFTDARGRDWTMDTYVEMAIRSAVVGAAVAGNLDTLTAAGHDLVIVSDAATICPICLDWRGQVLTITGAGGRHTAWVPHHDDPAVTVEVTVRGSVAQALADGLFHPHCRHQLLPYFPGVSVVPIHVEDPDGDEIRRELRHLVRMARRWDLRVAGALTEDARRKAAARARTWHALLASHRAAHPQSFPADPGRDW